jgi:iron complex transport system permease protein
VALLTVAASTLLGFRWIPWREVFATDPASYVFWQLRVPRSLLAACAGAGLAVGGVIFQALFRNPLAEPYTLGVASGASLAAAIGFLYGLRGEVLGGVPTLSALAFGGAVAAMGLVYLMSRLRAGRDLTRLLLAGVCVAYISSAGILLVTYLADRAVTNEIVRWLMGSLVTIGPHATLEIAIILLPVVALAAYSHRALDLLMLGEDLAASRGVNVGLTVWSCYVLVGLLTAAIVGQCGPIGFVGLMVPHIGRAIFGVRTLPLVIGSALLGAAFLALCDGIARLPRAELPVGVVTNILGAAFFFYLLATRDIAHGAVRR